MWNFVRFHDLAPRGLLTALHSHYGRRKGRAEMNEVSMQQVGEIAAITLVVRQLLARLPQEEQDQIRAFANSRLSMPRVTGVEVETVASAARRELDNLFTAAIPD